MEVGFVKNLSCGIKAPSFVSQHITSPIELLHTKLVAGNDVQEQKKCEHFSIRGYVADVRKRDQKIGWPFTMLHKHTPDGEPCSLPPLSVTRFRWWNCQNCLDNSSADETETSNGMIKSFGNGEVKNQSLNFVEIANVSSHPSGLQKLSDDRSSRGRSTEAGCSTALSDDFHWSQYFRKEDNKSVLNDDDREDFLSNDGCDTSEGNQNLFSGPFALTDCARNRPSVTCEKETVLYEKSFHTDSHSNGASNALDIRQAQAKGNQLIYRNDSSLMPCERPISKSNDIAAPVHKDGQGFAALANAKEPCDRAAKKCIVPSDAILEDNVFAVVPAHIADNCKADDSNANLMQNVNETKDDACQSTSNGNLRHKKVHKVRLLSDILKSEESSMADKVCVSNILENVTEFENHKDRGPDVLKGKAIRLYRKVHFVAKKTSAKPTKSHDKNVKHQNEDEGPPLMHWLKRLYKKKLKGEKDMKHSGDAVEESKFSADVSSGIHCLEGTSLGEKKQKLVVDRKEVKSEQLIRTLQQESMNDKGQMTIGTLPTKEFNSHPKLAGDGVPENGLHHFHGIVNNSTNKKVTVTNKKNKAPQGEDEGHWQTQRSKESSDGHSNNIINSLPGKKFLKKRKTIQKHDQEAVDDFPMEIVELLARNQHERCLVNAEAAREKLQNLTDMAEKMDNILDDFETQGVPLNKVPNSKTQSNRTENSSQTNAEICGSEEHRTKNYSSLSNVRQGLLSTSIVCTTFPQNSVHPINEVELPDFSPACYNPQNSCWNKMPEKTLQSCHACCTNSGQYPFENAQYFPSAIIDGSNPGTNVGGVNANFNQGTSYSFSERDLRTAADKTDKPKLTCTADANLQIRKRKAESLIHSGTIQSPISIFGYAENDCSSRLMMPINTYGNEAISAMHLCRLMSLSNSSGEPLCSPLESEFHCNNQFNEFLGSSVGFKIGSTSKHPWVNGNLYQDQQTINPSRPIRPTPRIGVLGSLLQDEITTRSNSCKTPFGLKDGHSIALSSFRSNVRSEREISHSSSSAKFLNAESCMSKDEIRCSMDRNGIPLVAMNNKDVIACVVNRNPADFSAPDDHGEYMIGGDLRTKDILSKGIQCPVDVDGPKRRKVMKLTALKGFMRS